MKPETVLEGAGAAAHCGRFASPGTPAVFLSESDAVATNEVTGRKKRLGGATLINVDKYPRIVFAVRFDRPRATPPATVKAQAVLSLPALFLAGCATLQSTSNTHGPAARRIARLSHAMSIMFVLAIVVMWVLLTVALKSGARA